MDFKWKIISKNWKIVDSDGSLTGWIAVHVLKIDVRGCNQSMVLGQVINPIVLWALFRQRMGNRAQCCVIRNWSQVQNIKMTLVTVRFWATCLTLDPSCAHVCWLMLSNHSWHHWNRIQLLTSSPNCCPAVSVTVSSRTICWFWSEITWQPTRL